MKTRKPRTRHAITLAIVSALVAISVAAPSAANAYAYNSHRWGTSTLRIGTPYLPSGGFKSALLTAVYDYSNRTDLTLSTVNDAGPSWSATGNTTGADGYEAYTYYYWDGNGTTTSARMNMNSYYMSQSMSSNRLKVVWEHEMGHALGLAHVATTARVMNSCASCAYNVGVFQLTSDEVFGINNLY